MGRTRINTKKMLAGMFVMAALLLPGSGMTAYAAYEVNNVTIDIRPYVADLEPGEIASEVAPEISSGNAVIYDHMVNGSKREKMLPFAYNITIIPQEGYEFSKNLSVTVLGVTKTQIVSVKKTGAEIKATTYPYFRLDNPTNIEEDGDGYRWNKVKNAKSYNVVVYYEDDNGNDRYSNQTVKKNEIDLSGSQWDDVEITNISVQAISGSTDAEHRCILPSQYVLDDGEVDDINVNLSSFTFPSASDKKSSSSSSSSSSSGSSRHGTSSNNNNAYSYGASGVNASSPGNQFATGWIMSPTGTWFRNPDGSWPANQWMYIKDGWYFFNSEGYLVQNGWIEWNGVWYCLDKNGKMYSNCWTPDGFYVNENGAWVR